jgi:DNA-binding XRE family transcriptional regulator
MRPLPISAPDASIVLGKATLRAAAELDLSHAALARIIGLSEPTISRIANHSRGIEPTTKEGQLALLLVRVFRALEPLVGQDARHRKTWLKSYNKALNGIPLALIETPYGLVATLSYLDGLRSLI